MTGTLEYLPRPILANVQPGMKVLVVTDTAHDPRVWQAVMSSLQSARPTRRWRCSIRHATAGIELVRGVGVRRLHPASKTELSDGSSRGYERLLLATGAEPRRLRVPGRQGTGTLSAERLRCDRVAAGDRAWLQGGPSSAADRSASKWPLRP